MHRRTTTLSHPRTPGVFIQKCLLGLLAALTMVPAHASASTLADPDPQWMVITSEVEPVRAGDQEIYYAIHEYKRGDLVLTDGVSGDYTKVRYPESFTAIAQSRDVQPIENGTKVQLTAESQLSAESLLRGFEGSWCPVYAEPLPIGTTLHVVEAMRDNKNEIVGYRVTPPAPPASKARPYAYVRTKSLRSATVQEIAKQTQSKAPAESTPAAKPTAQPTNQPAAQPTTQPTAQPAAQPATTPEIQPQPQTQSKTTPTQIDLTQSKVLPEPKVIKNTPPVKVNPDKSGSSSSNPARISASGLEALEASFTDARAMPREKLDEALPELLAEFTRTRDAAGDDEPLVRSLEQRIEWINIRIQTRDQRRAIAQALSSVDSQSQELTRKMDEWNNSRVYTLVGRLMLSDVYNGQHLPLLYRLRAPDRITGYERTVGYIAPNKDQDLRTYLGSVVGVVGTPVKDDALALTVLTPTRIDRMPGQ